MFRRTSSDAPRGADPIDWASRETQNRSRRDCASSPASNAQFYEDAETIEALTELMRCFGKGLPEARLASSGIGGSCSTAWPARCAGPNLARVSTDWKRTTRSLQPWRDRHHHHHDHGSRAEGPPRHQAGGAVAPGADVGQLCLELRLRRHLLEKAPPSVAGSEIR